MGRTPAENPELRHNTHKENMLDSERVTAPLSLRTRTGEPLLLLHGLGTSRRDFTAVIPALTDRFDVINVDLPGIGRSPHLEQRPTVAAITDAVEHTLDADGLDRVHVLGNSLGARIALELAVRGRARSVVAIAPSGLNILQERLYQGATMGLARIVMRAAKPLIASVSRSSAGRAALVAAGFRRIIALPKRSFQGPRLHPARLYGGRGPLSGPSRGQ
jgi:pimeloyl-ACP methyl ester carboxylesterase